MRKFDQHIISFLTDRLNDFEGDTLYTCDLPSELTMDENMNGCWIVYTEKAADFIRNNWEAARETYDYFNDEFGQVLNPFSDPEGFTFYMLLHGVEMALYDTETIADAWDDEIKLDRETIDRIVHELNGDQRLAWVCPACSDQISGQHVALKASGTGYECPKCGRHTESPADDLCYQVLM